MTRVDPARAYDRNGSSDLDPASVSTVVESPRRVLEVLRSCALERFASQERTLSIFFDEIRRELEVRASANAAAASAAPQSKEGSAGESVDELDELLVRLEDFLDSLLMGEKNVSLR